MKIKLVSFIIATTMVFSNFVSCYIPDSSKDIVSSDKTPNVTTSSEDLTDKNESSDILQSDMEFQTTYPEIFASTLKYTLSDSDTERFDKKLNECEQLFLSNKKENETKLKKALYELNSIKEFFDAQRNIAQLLYDCDLSDDTAKNNQYTSDEMYWDIHEKFWAFINSTITEDNVLEPTVREFEEKEFPLLLTKEYDASSYALQMTQIKNDIRKYNRSATYEQAHKLYTQYIYASQMYAKAYGYDNYYDYQTDTSYNRDYGKEERELFREYVKKYLVPLYRKYNARSNWIDLFLTSKEFALSEEYLNNRYDSFSENLLLLYLESLPASTRECMLEVFEKDRIIIADNDNSFDSAYIKEIGNTPICYLHENRANLIDVSHEIGHYYTHSYQGNTDWISFDLRETHSQGNTLLMLSYLNKKLDSRAFNSAQAFEISSMLYQTISSTIRDEFDEIVFSNPQSQNYSIEQLNQIMEDLIEEYDVSDISKTFTKQLMTYWNRLGTEQIAYQISYATSFVTALQIYLKSLNDYNEAVLCYQAIVEQIDKNSTFLKTISNAGLLSPLDEKLYEQIIDQKPF